MGDASYALYLIHPLVLWACRMVALKLGIPVGEAPWLYAACVMAAATFVSLVANQYFDQPVTGWLRKRFAPLPKRPPADAIAASFQPMPAPRSERRSTRSSGDAPHARHENHEGEA
jgi:peptidoglycan/LPS O-acetylase OafA/YrhL